MILKLIPFAKKCSEALPSGGIVQEDGALSHSHWYQEVVYNLHQVARIL